MRTLLVQDNSAVQAAYSKTLARFGSVDTADNGRDAVLLFVNGCQTGNRYDLLVIDQEVNLLAGDKIVAKIRRYEAEYQLPGNGAFIVLCYADLPGKVMSGAGVDAGDRIVFQYSPVSWTILESIAEKIAAENIVKVLPRASRYSRQINILA